MYLYHKNVIILSLGTDQSQYLILYKAFKNTILLVFKMLTSLDYNLRRNTRKSFENTGEVRKGATANLENNCKAKNVEFYECWTKVIADKLGCCSRGNVPIRLGTTQ